MDSEILITDKKNKQCKKSAEKRQRERSSSHSDSERHKIRKKQPKEKKKRHRTPSTSSTTSSESESERKRRKLKRKQRKEAKKLKKELKKRNKTPASEAEQQSSETNDIPIALMEKTKGMAPMTKDEWEKKQSVIRKVYDEQSGRHRLIKGDGEVIEEIVSRERHEAINRQATKGDANYFQACLTANMSKR